MIAKIEQTEQQSFSIVGIPVRTTNQNGQSQKDIGDLWSKYMAEGIAQLVTNKVSDDMYCLYTDYESDHTGYYTALIGCSVNSLIDLPAKLVGITVKAGKYNIYHLEGSFPKKVQDAWIKIWGGNIDRAYTADYDLYSAGAKSFEETEVKIYLAVKN